MALIYRYTLPNTDEQITRQNAYWRVKSVTLAPKVGVTIVFAGYLDGSKADTERPLPRSESTIFIPARDVDGRAFFSEVALRVRDETILRAAYKYLKANVFIGASDT